MHVMFPHRRDLLEKIAVVVRLARPRNVGSGCGSGYAREVGGKAEGLGCGNGTGSVRVFGSRRANGAMIIPGGISARP
jgi:hypothetical protein